MLFKFFGILGQGDVLRPVDFAPYIVKSLGIINPVGIDPFKTQPFQFRHFALPDRFRQGFHYGVLQNQPCGKGVWITGKIQGYGIISVIG